MKIAFLISAYTDAAHLKRLIASLPTESGFYVHIDKKSDITPFTDMIDSPRVHFIDHRFTVMWGTISQVCYQMELFRAALKSGVRYDYFFTMSGLEYPLWSNDRIIAFLEKNKEKNYLKAICMTNQITEGHGYEEYRFYADKPWKKGSLGSKMRVLMRKTTRLFKKKPLEFDADGHHYKLYKGSDWFGITPELATFVLDRWDTSPQLRKYFKTSFTPSETLIHTVAFNSDYADKCILAEGQYESLAALTPLTYIYYRPDIKILTEGDYDTLIESGKMFCRKVISGKSDALMDIIDKHRNEE